jgi:putative RecB family exonuclease
MSDLLLSVGPTHVSYSSFSTFLHCGEQWRLSRVEQVPEQPAWYLAGGSAVHEATELLDRQALAEPA